MQFGSAAGTEQDTGTNSHKSLPGSASRVRRGGQDPKCAGASGGGDLGGDVTSRGAAGGRANPADSQERSGSSFLLQVRSGFPGGLVEKSPPAGAGDERHAGSISGWGRSSAGGHGNPLQYSCLETPMDRGAWRAIVCGIEKSWIGHC